MIGEDDYMQENTHFPSGKLSENLNENIAALKKMLPIGTSFDFIGRDLYLGETSGYFLSINGFCKTEILQQIFSDLQYPLFTRDDHIDDIIRYMNAKMGYAQVTLCDRWEDILHHVLSGPSALFVDGSSKAIIIDTRSYPTRGIAEPDTERITKGARDGFVETMLFNANLIRRRIRSPHLTFSLHTIGTQSRTDVAVAYLDNCVNKKLLQSIFHKLDHLDVSTLTMGSKSLEELLLPKKWWHPMPSVLQTERPDLACSYLSEGHILIIVDNSPIVLILPCTIFQFTQSAEDYYKSPLVGNYFRLVRFLCIPISLFLMPLFLLITAFFPELSREWQLLSVSDLSPGRIIFYVFAMEFLLNLFRYSASINSSRFSGSLSIVGGLLIGDMAVSLNWASPEILFYGAITLLCSLSITNLELSDALRVYRIFLTIFTGLWGLPGFLIGVALILLSLITTPTFGGMSYFWPLVPFNYKALKMLLFRQHTASAQPPNVWNRGNIHKQ